MISFLLIGSTHAQLTPASALHLDGIDDMIYVAKRPSLNISSAITIESWIKPTKDNAVQDIFCKSSRNETSGYIFPRTPDGWLSLSFWLNINGAGEQVLTVPYGYEMDEWHHTAATYDGFFMRVYIDGVLAGEKEIAGVISVNDNPLTIGGQDGYGNEFFQGSLDEGRIWNRALTQCEIANNMYCQLGASQVGLAAYYKYNQGFVDVPNILAQLTDASGNNANGTLTNFGLLGATSNWTAGIVNTTNTCNAFAPVVATAGSESANVPVGGTIRLTATGGGTYAWAGPNGYTSNQQNPVLTGVGANASGTYSVTVTNNGCSVIASTIVNVAPRGSALALDGVDDYIVIPNSPSFNTNNLTIESWVYPTSSTPLVQNVLSKSNRTVNNGYIFPRTDDGWQTFSFWLAVNGDWKVVSAPYTAVNKWTHVAASYDGFYMRIYLNGVEAASLFAPGSVTTNANDIYLGQQEGKLEFFPGKIDELRFWSRALTQCEIQNNRNCELKGAANALASQIGLGAYYRFNQGLAGLNNAGITTLADSSGHGNNGSMQGFDLDASASNWIQGSAINGVNCNAFTGVPAVAGNNGPVIEVGATAQFTASNGTSWSWTGPNNFTSSLQNPTITNPGTENSGTYTVAITGSGCTSLASTKLTVAYKAGTLDFDGINDQVTVPVSNSLNIPNTITLEAWIFPTDGTKQVQNILSKSTKDVNTGYIFPRTNDGWRSFVFYLHLNGQWVTLSSPYTSLNEWHHLAATYDGYYMRIYMDGVQQASKLAAGNIDNNANDLIIGQQPGFTEFFSGKLEEVRIWNRALNQCEIINNMNCELAPSGKTGLAANYSFNQGFLNADNTSITTLLDASDNHNDGTLNAFTLDGAHSNWSAVNKSGSCPVYSLPPVTAGANGSIFGINSTIVLFSSGGFDYTWDGPNNFASSAQNPSITNAQVNMSGTYTVSVPFVHCVVTASTRLTVSALAPIAASGPTTFCPSGSVTLSTSNPGTTFQWYKNDAPITGANSNSYIATETGSYSVSVTNGLETLITVPVSVTVADNQAPVPVIASLPVLNLVTPAVITTFPTALDICRGAVTATTLNTLNFTQPGTYTITWNYDDHNGNTSAQTQQVVVVDHTPPVVSAPGNISVNAAPGSCGATVGFNATATDNSTGPIAITYSQNPGTQFTSGNTVVTITATDQAGNSATASFVITVIDTQNPTITAPAAVNTFTNAGCSATNVVLGTPVTADNCTVASVTNNHPSATYPLGATTVTWTVTDGAGHTATATQVVTVTDNILPTIVAPSPVTVSANSGCLATNVSLGTPNAADNCSFTVSNNHPSTTFTGGTTIVTWTATDAAGNSATATQLVTVTDDVDPVITKPAAFNALVTTGCTATGVTLPTPAVADNCSIASVGNNHPSGTYPLGTTIVTWTVTDGAGRTATTTQDVIVTDNINPTITAPANVHIDLAASEGCNATGVVLGTPLTADNCTVASVTNDHSSSTFPVGVTIVTWTVTDGSGRTATATQTVTIVDNDAPEITAPAAVVAYTNAGCTATGVALGTPHATDNCTIATVTNNHISTTYPLGQTLVTWTVTDAAGKTATATQLVTVIDNVDPTIAAAAPVQVDANTGCTATGIVLAAPAAADNCTVVSVTNDHPSGIFPIGTTTVTWTVTDGAGRTATTTQVVTVVDNTNPTITAPPTVNATVNNGCIATGVSIGTATASGNCSLVTITNNHPSNSYPVGTTIVTWTATNAAGKTATATQAVIVADGINPVITAPDAVTAFTNAGCTATNVALGAPSVSDNCTVTTVSNDHGSATFPIGTTTVTWTVMDAAGNSATATQLVTVTDNVNPTIIAAANVTVPVDNGCTATVVLTAPTVADNCTLATVTNNHPSSVFGLGTTVVTWTVTDAAGNTKTANQSVTVVDNINPTITAPPAVIVNVNAGCSAANVSLGTPDVSDNCTLGLTSNDHPSGTYPIGTTTVTWTVKDVAGNMATATQLVTVKDNVVPVISTPASITVAAAAGCEATGVVLPVPSVSDNCGAAVLTLVNDHPSTTYQPGLTTVTWTVTDAAGNSAIATQAVTVTVPEITVAGDGNTIGQGDVTPSVADNTDLGETVPGTPISKTYIISNSGTSALTISSINITGANAAEFVVSGIAFPANIAANSSASFVVTFSSANAGSKNAMVVINNNDCDEAAYNFAVAAVINCSTPVFTSSPSDMTVNAVQCSAAVSYSALVSATPTASFSYAFTGATVSNGSGTGSGTNFAAGRTQVVLTATNTCGSAQHSFDITVLDVTSPSITCPASVSVSCGGSTLPQATGTATATDNCSGVTVSYTDSSAANKIIRKWKATDASGNVSTCSQTITLTVTTTTITSVPSNNTFTGGVPTSLYLGYGAQSTTLQVNSAASGAPYTYAWTSTNGTLSSNTTGNPVFTPAAGGSYTFNVVSTNRFGCSSNASITICVTDIRVMTVNNSNDDDDHQTMCNHAAHDASDCSHKGHNHKACNHKAHSKYACDHMDNDNDDQKDCDHKAHDWKDCSHKGHNHKACDHKAHSKYDCDHDKSKGSEEKVCDHKSHDSKDCSHSGHHHGECSHKSHTASTCHHNGGHEDDNDDDDKKVYVCHVASSGVRNTLSVSVNAVAAHLANHAGDRLGSCDQQPCTGWFDNVKPEIDCPGSITVGYGASTLPAATGSADAEDNSGAVAITYTDVKTKHADPNNIAYYNYTITRTWKATDPSGNFSVCTQLITVQDVTKPVISCPGNTTVSCGGSTASSSTGVASANDNSGGPVTVSAIDIPFGGVIYRTWKATDVSGNTNYCIQSITVIADNVKPVLADPADVTLNCGASTDPSNTGTPTATDNCSGVLVNYTDAVSGNVITRTWKATDASGNYSTTTQKITVGAVFTSTISSVPSGNTYTGGVATNLYLGYGAQSTTLQIAALPSAGAPYTYAWSGSSASGSATGKLSSTSGAAPVFTPTTFGYYTFSVVITNKYGCTYNTSINICVTDVKVAGSNGTKVYVTHTPKNGAAQTLQVLISQVPLHIGTTACGGSGSDRLGTSAQSPCSISTSQNSITGISQDVTKEGGSLGILTTEEELKVIVMPNPSTTYFTLKFESRYETPVSLRVMDGNGRVVDAKTKIGSNSTFQIGHNYSSGTYYAEIIQGSKRQVIQLIKARG